MSCFCGCGRAVKGIKAKAANAFGEQAQPMLAVLQGALEVDLYRDDQPDRVTVEALVGEGRRQVEALTLSVHGQAARGDLDKKALRDWSSQATDAIPDVARRVTADGWFGPALRTHELVCTGVRGTGTVVGLDDTRITLQHDPRLGITIEVHPDDGEPYEVRRDVTVSRLRLPRVGDPVEVAWAPGEPEDFAYRVVPASTPPVADGADARLEKLRQLGDLRASGVLNEAEFEAEKQRILGEAP